MDSLSPALDQQVVKKGTPLVPSLYGRRSLSLAKSISLFLISCAYEGLYWDLTKEECMLIASKADTDLITRWSANFDPVETIALLDDEMTREKLITTLQLAGSKSECSMIYVSGHGTRTESSDSFAFLPIDCIDSDKVNPERGLSDKEIRGLLLSDDTSRFSCMVLITDFCFVNNVLQLPYALDFEEDGTPFWRDVDPGAPERSLQNHGRKILHFTGAAEGKMTYGTSSGGLFTREFCAISPNESISLAERVWQIQNNLAAISNGKNYYQKPQLFSSHKMDLSIRVPLSVRLAGAQDEDLSCELGSS